MTDAGANCGAGAVNGASGHLDGVSIVEGHELAETVTDPLLNGWYGASLSEEIGDKCAWTSLANVTTSPGRFAMQPLWSNANNGCVISYSPPPPPYEVAFQANTGSLWTFGTAGSGDRGLGMMAGTSPSIAALPGGGYEVAFQANTGSMWTFGTAGTGDRGLGMKSATSPSIAAVGGGYEVAFQANTGSLWTFGTAGTGDHGLGMMAGTSPSIAALSRGGYEVAFQANTGNLWTTGSADSGDHGLGMRAGSSPSIAGF